jgi:hypothetical protein
MTTGMELQVKQVLDMAVVSMALYAQCLCFGREIWSPERRGVSGDILGDDKDAGLRRRDADAVRRRVTR